jgi:DNA processing protein
VCVVPSYYPVVALMLTKGAVPADCFNLPPDPARVFSLLRTSGGRRELSLVLRKPLGDVNWTLFDFQIEMIEGRGFEVVTCLDDSYPSYFRDIPQSPSILFHRGDRSRLDRRGVAVVGSRRASARGVAFTRSLAGEIAALGIPVVSGAARGIDTAAHRGALDRGGTTVAVLGTGLDVPYPPGNAQLLDEIAAEGCVVSEQLFGTPPLKHVFPQRNRLISGLSHAVVVVEAGERSGALITARWALEQGRDVGAVPGFPGDPRSRGSNRLIKTGAFAVENAADILEAVPVLGPRARPAPFHPQAPRCDLPENARAVLDALGSNPVDVDLLARHLDLAAGEVLGLLLELELRGLVERDASGAYHTR